MTVIEIADTLARLKSKGGRFAALPCEDPLLVLSAQDGLGIVFPESFVTFYQCYPYLQVRSDEFMQIDYLVSSYQARQQRTRQKQCLFPVLEDGMGGWWYVVCTYVGKKEPSDFGCVMYNPGCEGDALEYASSEFIKFVISRIEKWEETL
jgi:hypothetical protein